MDVASWKFTRVESIKKKYLWSIVNFSDFIESRMKSPHFPFPHDKEIKFYLELCTYQGIAISLHEVRERSTEFSNFQARVKLSILNADKSVAHALSEMTIDARGHDYVDGYFDLNLRNLKDPANRILPNDTLTILCEVDVFISLIHSENNYEKIEMPPCSLSQDLEKVFVNAKFCDVVLIAEGVEFPAHKAILSARSPVFKAMFEFDLMESKVRSPVSGKRFKHDIMESKPNRIEIKDLEAKNLREMLKFMYTGEVSDLKAIASGLLAAADKYGLERLKSMCERAMYASLNIENAVELLLRADLHSAQALKAEIITFINGHAALVKKTEGWKNITGPLVVELYNAD